MRAGDGIRNCEGTAVPDRVSPKINSLQRRSEVERVCQHSCATVADSVGLEIQLFKNTVEFESSAERTSATVVQIVAAKIEPRDQFVGAQGSAQNRSATFCNPVERQVKEERKAPVVLIDLASSHQYIEPRCQCKKGTCKNPSKALAMPHDTHAFFFKMTRHASTCHARRAPFFQTIGSHSTSGTNLHSIRHHVAARVSKIVPREPQRAELICLNEGAAENPRALHSQLMRLLVVMPDNGQVVQVVRVSERHAQSAERRG